MLTVSPIFVVICAAMFVAMGFHIAQYRRKNKFDLGDCGDAHLLQMIRAHGNAAEYMPMGLLLLVVLDLMDAPTNTVAMFGVVFVLGRAIHAAALLPQRQNYRRRFIGMILTFFSMIAMTFAIVVLSIE